MAGQIGYGATVRVGEAGATYSESGSTALGEVTSITPPNPSRDIIDVTSMDSPNTAREFIAGLIDYGEAGFELNWTPGDATDALLRTILLEDEPRAWRFTFAVTGSPSTVTCTFDAFLTNYQPQAPMDDKMTGSISLKVTGAPVWA